MNEMEQSTIPQPEAPRASKDITDEEVRALGRERLNKVLDFFEKYAAPDLIIQRKIAQEGTKFMDGVSNGVTEMTTKYDNIKKAASDKATVFLKWGMGLALAPLGKIEGAFQSVSDVIDGVREWKAVVREKKVVKLQEKLEAAETKARESRKSVSETKESTKNMTTMREMAASLKA